MARIHPTQVRTTGVGFAVGIGRFGAILGPSLFGYFADNGYSTNTLFMIFSVPLLVMGTCVWSLKASALQE